MIGETLIYNHPMHTALRFISLLLILLLAGCAEDKQSPASKKGPKSTAHLVEAVTASLETVQISHERTGSLRHRRVVRIYNQEEGRIIELPGFEGDSVKQGEILVRLEDDLLQAERTKARATTRQAKQDLARIEELVQKRAASADEEARAGTALEIAQAEERILDTRIEHTRSIAPFDGIITQRLAELGDVMPRHTHLLTLADPASLVTELSVSELILPGLANGSPVSVRIDALGDQPFSGEIIRIHPELDSLSRQGKVEIQLNPVPPGARAGQFVRVTLRTVETPRLLVPFGALRRDRQGEYLYLLENGSAQRVNVRSGIRLEEKVEIIEGLRPGQQVITRGFLGLRPGKEVHTGTSKN